MMRNGKTTIILSIKVFILAIILSLVAMQSMSVAEMPKVITIMSFPTGSAGSIMATAFSEVIEDKSGIRCRPTPSDNDISRFDSIRNNQAELGIVPSSSVYDASRGTGDFNKENWGPQKLRLVYSGSAVIFGLAVKADSNIKNWTDLRGKRITQAPGVQSSLVRGMLAYGGLAPEDVVIVASSGYTNGIRQVMNGSADACILAVTTPIAKEWESSPYGLRYLPCDPNNKKGFESLRQVTPYMSFIWTTYGALGEGGEKWLPYYPYYLISYNSIGEDVIYLVLKSLVEGREEYKDILKPSSTQWTIENTLDYTKAVDIPFHSGLVKFAKENKFWTDDHEKFQEKTIRDEENRIRIWSK